MSILEAAMNWSAYSAALAYAEAGLSVIPCIGKQPAVPWMRYKQERASVGRIRYWNAWQQLTNIGVICGRVSELVVIDLDGLQAVEQFEMTFPHLLDTLTIITGSRKGKHYWYSAAGLSTQTVRTAGVEVRGDGCYVIAPPSVHPVSCLPYMVERFAEPAALDLAEVRRWVSAKNAAHNQPKPAPIKTSPGNPTQIRNPAGYALAALREECAAVRGALEGGRNTALYHAALKMGSLISLGWLDQWVAEKELMSAASSLIGSDGESSVVRTIASGFKAGAAGDRTSTFGRGK